MTHPSTSLRGRWHKPVEIASLARNESFPVRYRA
jgi:hypothetical protein